MGTITQVTPLTSSVATSQSSTFQVQLEAIGGIGTLLWETTAPSINVTVLPNGLFTTSGTLGPTLPSTPYVISGTVSDLFGNIGTWSFSLTVTGNISPQLITVPFDAAQPSGLVIATPFHIDPATGGVAILSNYFEILEQELSDLIRTSLGERLMLPNYGGNIESQLFQENSVATPQISAFLAELTREIASNIPEVSIISIKPSLIPGSPSTLSLSVSYTTSISPAVNSLVINSGGTIAQVSSP